MPPAITRRRSFAALGTAALVVSALLVTGEAASSPRHSPAAYRSQPATPELIDAAEAAGEITPTQATVFRAWSLTRPAALPEEFRSDTPWSGTLTMLRVQRALRRVGPSRMSPALAAAAAGVSQACPGSGGRLPQTKSTAHFAIKYRASAIRGGLKVTQYAGALEATWNKEIRRFGWARPPRDPVNPQPGGRYLVRVAKLGSSLYGYVTGTFFAGNNPSTPWNERDSVASCMVLNQNMGPFPGAPIDALRATAAHEFNHSIQFGYGALNGPTKVRKVFVEAGASWMEDEVFDGADDNYSYLWPDFERSMATYSPGFAYPYWVVFRAMTERYGTGRRGGGEDVMQRFWEQISKGASTNLAALNRALKPEGRTLAKAYHDAAVALRFNAGCGANPKRWCLQEGDDYVTAALANADTGTIGSVDGQESQSIGNDYALDWIGLPTGAAFNLSLDVTSGKGKLRMSVLCLSGGALTQLDVTVTATPGTNGVNVDPIDPSGCDEVVAIITNEYLSKPLPKQQANANFTLDASAA